MPLLDLQQSLEFLGPSIMVMRRSRNFQGALVNKIGLAVQNIPRNTAQMIQFNTEIDDVGGWFDNSTSSLRERFTVVAGILFVRLFLTIEFSNAGVYSANDTVIHSLFKNGVLLGEFGRLNVPPTNGVNFNTFTTLPIPCVPGDFFGVNTQFLAVSALPATKIANTATTSFAIEAVVGG